MKRCFSSTPVVCRNTSALQRFRIAEKYLLGEPNMAYTKPEVVAQNGNSGSFAAGCPEKDAGQTNWCKNCERTK